LSERDIVSSRSDYRRNDGRDQAGAGARGDDPPRAHGDNPRRARRDVL